MTHDLSILSKLCGNTSSRQEFLDSVVRNLRELTGSQCIGIRVLNAAAILPYESFSGFSPTFWAAENCLSLHEHQCACIRAVKGTPDPFDRSIFTRQGSLWTDDLQSFGQTIPEDLLPRYRGKCIESGFRTLAVIPLRGNQQVLGLLHLADQRPAILSAEQMALLEALSHVIGTVILRFSAEEALRLARDAADEASKAKSEFLANMSHEIRTPMTVFMAAIEHLLQIDADPERRQLLEMADGAATRLFALIEDVLDFSRIEAQRVNLEEKSFDLRVCLQDTAEMMNGKLRAKNLHFSLDIAEDIPPRVVGDAGRLGQILINLIDNAVKFTPQGEVRVSARKEGALLVFAVSDSGIGVPAEQRAMIFESFRQADSSLTRAFGGSGLGLAICKGLVQLMGGDIGVRDRDGQGSVFYFTLPCNAAGGQADAQPAHGPVRKPGAKAPRLRILLAEDEPMVREMLLLVMAERGWLAETAKDGAEAFRKWQEGDFDFILMDVQMPVLNGLDSTRKIREEETGRHTCIVGLTAHARQEVQEECLAAGMDAVFTKPVRMQELLSALEGYSPAAGFPAGVE
jgi:signal transduction histidine kinase/ActR/RegA family two-component response regulator